MAAMSNHDVGHRRNHVKGQLVTAPQCVASTANGRKVITMSSSLPAGWSVAVRLGLPLAGAALVAAACSSGSQSGYGAGAPAPATGTSHPTLITTGSAADRMFLTDGSGRALYLWEADGRNTSTCSGGCASEWPPLTTSGTPKVSGGASAADIGTITRTDGSKQVTYNGHALYFFAGDTRPGQTEGQGSTDFGADWWLVAPDGSKITVGERDGS